MTPAAIPAAYPSLPDSGRWPDGWQCAAGRRRSFGWCRRPPRSSLRRRRGATVVGTARRGGPTACRCTICGGRNCGVDLSVENVDRPRPDQQRRSVLPAGVPSTSSTGHPRGACRDKAQRRGPASGHDSRVLDAETEQHGALCTPGNPCTCAVRTPPQARRGGVHFVLSQRMPHRYSTVAH